MDAPTPWSPPTVAARLVAAYRLMPGRPVLSSAAGFRVEGEGVAEVFAWPDRFLADPWDRRVLTTWAYCIAMGLSVRERYRGFGWPRRTAERRRRLALAAIADGLNRELTVAPKAPQPPEQAPVRPDDRAEPP